MKKNITYLFLGIFLALSGSSFAQLARDSWSFGFGVIYPRMLNPNLGRSSSNYGGYLSVQRNFSEHIGLRLKMNYISITGLSGNKEVISNSAIGDLDMIYYLVPCEPVSPYLSFGIGGIYTMFDNPIPATLEDQIDYELNLALGAEWTLDEDWKLLTEIAYHTTDNQSFDGSTGVSTGSLLGSLEDAYLTLKLGLQIYFSKGEPSRYCQIYSGLSGNTAIPDPVDYERIENIVQKYIPREVIKEVVVEKPVESKYSAGAHRWVLVGVNFDFSSERLSNEAYPVLFHAVQVLLQNPEMKIEIEGHTDNIGTEKGNQKLSLKRAIAVKNYLVARGVSADRITTVGYGESRPIADNKTAQGRAMNRRIEFKVMN